MFGNEMYTRGHNRSCIRDLFEYGLRRAAQVGAEYVYDYSLGNPSVPAPKEVNEAIAAILHEEDSVQVHGYTPAAGSLEARTAVAADLNRRYAADAKPGNLFLTCGAAPALISVLLALAVPESELVILTPYFPEYTVFAKASGHKAVYVPAAKDFRLDSAAVAAKLTVHTQAVLVNTPNNPSGVVYTRSELSALAEVLREKSAEFGHPIYLIADEPYRELVYDGVEVPFIPTIYENTVVCYSWSKSLSLPGERIGYVFVPDSAADAAELYAAVAGAARSIGHVCPPSLMQKVITRCVGVMPDLASYDRNRHTLYEALTSYGYECIYPSGAFYMLVKSPFGSSAEFSDRAKEEGLLIVPGNDFGCPDYCRLCTCVSHDMILRSLPVFEKLIK